jgi:hypothetical protein
MSMDLVREAKRQHVDLLLQKKNVVACGVGFKQTDGQTGSELCVVVSVEKKLPEAQLMSGDIVPKMVGQVKTDVQESGVLRAFQSRTDRWRPAPGGVSIGHVAISAGTLGCLVSREGQLFILSNNHVLAASNVGQIGDGILQPGPADGGTSNDRIAVLEDFIPLDFGSSPPVCPTAKITERILNALARVAGSDHRITAFQETPGVNKVDAALARPLSPDLVDKNVVAIGLPKGAREGTLNTNIKKSGRTTGLTHSQITQIDATVKVSYGSAGNATLVDQLVAGNMSLGGDSGSAVLDNEGYVVGLLFAGSETTTIINRIQNVLDALRVTIAV